MKNDLLTLSDVLSLGEGQTVEFKEGTAHLDREIVGFANAGGGTIFCGVSDKGEVVGTSTDNRALSQLQDIGRNCDPSLRLTVRIIDKKVVALFVPEGEDKPYQCSSGFYLRIGASCQKLRAIEIRKLMGQQPSLFDAAPNESAPLQETLSLSALARYCDQARIASPSSAKLLLENLSAVKNVRINHTDTACLTNAGVLLFTDAPRRLVPESYITVVRYQGPDRFSVVDRQEFDGDILQQLNQALAFVKRHSSVSYDITGDARRVEHYEYPLPAIREALVNAVVHRDYRYHHTCIYLSMYSDRIEIENPGGILGGITPEEIQGRSVRRNPILADLLYRAGYGEKLGSGLARIRQALEENGNPPCQVVSTNFFSIRFLPRVVAAQGARLTPRQLEIVSYLRAAGRALSGRELANHLGVGVTTIFRDMKVLLASKLVERRGVGKAARYCSV